jgi:hypothetical protein
MPYFPKRTSPCEETWYRCHRCGKDFYQSSIRCFVSHAPGTCCHQYEEPAEDHIAKTLRNYFGDDNIDIQIRRAIDKETP